MEGLPICEGKSKVIQSMKDQANQSSFFVILMFYESYSKSVSSFVSSFPTPIRALQLPLQFIHSFLFTPVRVFHTFAAAVCAGIVEVIAQPVAASFAVVRRALVRYRACIGLRLGELLAWLLLDALGGGLNALCLAGIAWIVKATALHPAAPFTLIF